ncbi:MAG: hypothetical protein ABJA83_09035 [Burkholderiaceae bacterium]
MRAPDPFEIISGQSEAEAFLISLRCSLGDGDELFYFMRTMNSGSGGEDRLRGVCRTLQKQIERGQMK